MSMSEETVEIPVKWDSTILNAYGDAREVVRLLQCSRCSYPLREPITLPCGNSLCRPCLPPIYKRENITYPRNEGRSEGFICPFKDCELEHSMGDCSIDVTLRKVVDVVKSYIASYREKTTETPIHLDEQLHLQKLKDSSIDVMPRSRVLPGGRLIATYIFAAMGELDYHSEVLYTPINTASDDTLEALDVAVFETIREATRTELECQVCYAVMLDPLTTSCGHTFCRRCVTRVLDHSNLCPICRRRLPLAPTIQGEPSNKRISHLLQGLLADLVAQRLNLIEQEDALDEDSQMPLFPCTLAFPKMPTFLHIFEPRYRLMIRRVMENGSRRFGMLSYNHRHQPQGTLGPVHFMQYGTILQVDDLELLDDGRSLMLTRGVCRFRVLETSMLDGYHVGKIQRIEDMSIAEEEAIEARETSTLGTTPNGNGITIDQMPTQQLLEYCLNFVSQARGRSARWLHQRVLDAYGQAPTDPAIFPYWFASILPIAEHEKYLLLPTDSVRERLKITVRWIQRLEAARCELEAELRAMRASATSGTVLRPNEQNVSQQGSTVTETATSQSDAAISESTEPAVTPPTSIEPPIVESSIIEPSNAEASVTDSSIAPPSTTDSTTPTPNATSDTNLTSDLSPPNEISQN